MQRALKTRKRNLRNLSLEQGRVFRSNANVYLRVTEILGWTLSAGRVVRAAGGLFRWFKPFITARRWLSLRWPQSPGSGKQFFSKQTTREPRVLAESFPKGFASRLLPGRTAAWPVVKTTGTPTSPTRGCRQSAGSPAGVFPQLSLAAWGREGTRHHS